MWLRSPLFIVGSGKNEKYYFTDEDFLEAKERGEIKGNISRAKGLGALDSDQAARSMFSKEFQKMDAFTSSEEAFVTLGLLMGKDVAPRAEFIFENVDFSKIKE